MNGINDKNKFTNLRVRTSIVYLRGIRTLLPVEISPVSFPFFHYIITRAHCPCALTNVTFSIFIYECTMARRHEI